MANNGEIAIIDLGGQYCHLIARRLRDLAIGSGIFPPEVGAETISRYAGLILSGGPQSVYEASALTIDPGILGLDLPILGICYGHQLLARLMGGEVAPQDGEYGFAQLITDGKNSLFDGTPPQQQVWMSHSDAVHTLPAGAASLASTDRCANAAFADSSKRIFGLQFHPEVVHTQFGARILENFIRSVCKLTPRNGATNRVPALCERIRRTVGDRSVFFLISGGVDSTVAFVLCGMALPKERVLGLYVDTGLMRQGEADELRANLAMVGLHERIKIWDASTAFLGALQGEFDPEEKRRIIGRLFVDIQAQAMAEYGIAADSWMLGQGTIYPDTIESGGDSGRAAVIKTHHNRCDEIRALIQQGKVIEPLAEFYKDEVREIGNELGLSPHLTNRWPFPGPGLAIRCLCAQAAQATRMLPDDLQVTVEQAGFEGVLLPLRSVGVQGDARTYRMVVGIEQRNHQIDYAVLRELSSSLCNRNTSVNRVALLIGGNRRLADARVVPAAITPERVEILRKADFIARTETERFNLAEEIWQFPVILAPIAFNGGESIILRPVNSVDGMTASFASLPEQLVRTITGEILRLPGVDAVLMDVTNKPPATIEWE